MNVLRGLALLAWAVYLGGALTMEFVWRPTQASLPMSQIGVACRRMGRRYRWVALGALASFGLAATLLTLERDGVDAVSGRDGVLLAAWSLLVGLVARMAFRTHPALHVRVDGTLDDAERDAQRARVARAIRNMDRCLRAELVVALAATGLLAAGAGG